MLSPRLHADLRDELLEVITDIPTLQRFGREAGVKEHALPVQGCMLDRMEELLLSMEKKQDESLHTFLMKVEKEYSRRSWTVLREVLRLHAPRPPSSANADERAILTETVRREKTPEPGPIERRYALLIGLNEYKHYARLSYAQADVRALEQVFKRAHASDSPFQEICVLTDDKENFGCPPTLENIIHHLTRLCTYAHENDLLWVHFSGHGTRNEQGEPILLLADSSHYTLERFALKVNTILELLKSSKARRLLLTLDACHQGLGKNLRSVNHLFELSEMLSRSTGTAILSASAATEVAQEVPLLGHGLFTHFMIEALEGKAEHYQAPPRVTLHDLQLHVEHSVQRWCRDNRERLQYPNHQLQGFGSFVVLEKAISNA